MAAIECFAGGDLGDLLNLDRKIKAKVFETGLEQLKLKSAKCNLITKNILGIYMSIFNKIKTTVQASKNLAQKYLEDYITFSTEAKQLILKRKTVLLLCQQAVSRVEQLKSLEPDSKEGLIATIEYKTIQVQVHFTPERITLNEDSIEGQLRLLTPPEFQSDSLVYRYLIAGWKIFLGGKIPNGALPERVRIENNKVYYTLPRNQLQLLDALFSSLEKGSALITSLKQGDLIIESSVALSWNEIKLQKLLQVLKLQS